MSDQEQIPELVARRAIDLINAYLLARSNDPEIQWDGLTEVVPKVDALLDTNKRTVYEFIETLLHAFHTAMTVAGDRIVPPMTPYEIWRATGERFADSGGDDGKGGEALP